MENFITDRAKSPSQVLAQVQPKGTDQTNKLLLMEGTGSTNLDLEVSHLAVAGKADFGGGLVWHAVDDRNYYLLRVSLIEQKLRLYRVVKGVPQVVKQIDRPSCNGVAYTSRRAAGMRDQSPS